jgi:acetyl esterase/lipase
MERAAGGAKLFASQSPTVILRKYTTGATAPGAVQGSRNVRKKKRHGDAIAERAGFTVLNSESSFHEKIQSIDVLSEVNPKRLPPFSLLCSTSDTVVPWRESSDMLMALREAGVDAELLMYDHVGHGDFVVDWKPDASSEIKEHSKDLVEILQYGSEEVD